MITQDLLEALLSPVAERRRQGEAYLQAMTPSDRCTALVTALFSTCQQQQQQQQHQSGHYQQLVAVLLRRDILKSTDAAFLQDLVLPGLLQAFESNQQQQQHQMSSSSPCSSSSSASSSKVQTAIGNCLAEVCSVLSWIAPAQAVHATKRILQSIATSASQANVASLQLLVCLAERAPRAFVETDALASLPQLVSAALHHAVIVTQRQPQHDNDNNQQHNTIISIVGVLTELVVRAAMAASSSEQEHGGGGTTATTTLLCEEYNPPSGQAAQRLGVDCLAPLVPWIVQSVTTSTSGGNSVLQHLILGAEQVPWLLAGQTSVMEAIVQCCLTIATTSTTMTSSSGDNNNNNNMYDDGDDEHNVSLQAVQVLASLMTWGPVRRQAVSPLMRTAIVETCTKVCLTVALSASSNDDDNNNDLDEWAMEPATLNQDGFDGEDGDSVAVYAQDLLEAILRAFASQALAVVLPAVEQLLATSSLSSSSSDSAWTQHRVALAALQRCVLAAPLAFEPHFCAATEAGLNYCSSSSDNNFRVQYEAILLLGVLCETDKNNQIRKAFGHRLLQALGQAAQSKCTKVAAAACSAIVSYCRPSSSSSPLDETDEDVRQGFVVPFLSNVLAALVAGPLSCELENVGWIVVKVRAIGAVACLAEAAQDAFSGFYSSVMPGLLACANAQASSSGTGGFHQYELSRLRGSAVEAATVIGQSIGEDNLALFAPDAEQIMQSAMAILRQPISEGDEVVSGVPLDQLLSACARVASVMKEAYAPYAGVVLPHLLKRATDPSDIEISEGDEASLAMDATKLGELQMHDDTGTKTVTVAVPGRGLQTFTISTHKIQEKSVAARGIYEHAVALGPEFGPYSKACLDAFLLLVQFKFSSELRATSAQTLAAVFEAACSHGESAGMELPGKYFPLVSKALSKQIANEDETDQEALYALSEALSEVCYSVYQRLDEHGNQLVSEYKTDCSKHVVRFCMKAMAACLGRRDKLTSVLSGAEGVLAADEREDIIKALAHEEALLTPLVDSVGYNLKFLRHEFVPIFETEVAPVLSPYLRAGYDIRARLSAVCLFDDCVEYCGAAAAARFAPTLVDGAVAGLNDDLNGHDQELKRASIYGIAQICRYAPSSVLSPFEDKIIPPLLSMACRPKPEDDDLAQAVFENAVSALASLTLLGSAPFQNSRFVKRDVAVNLFLKNLPLREDADEAKFCHSLLCSLVEKQVVPLSDCNELFRIIGETLALVDAEEDLASEETVVRFAGILFRLYQEGNRDQTEAAFNSLSVDAHSAIQKAMGQYAHLFNNVVTP